MYAIIAAGGKQYQAVPGQTLQLDRFSAQPGDAFETDQVLFVKKDDNQALIGTPTIAGATVQGTVVEQGKDKKIVIFKRKRRKNFRWKKGHRQPYTLVQINAINA